MEFTYSKVKENLELAVKQLKQTGYREDAMNIYEVIFAEHWRGCIIAGGTVYLTRDGTFNVDFDNRCDCCGDIFQLHSVDFTEDSVGVAAKLIYQMLNDPHYSDYCDCE